MQSIVGVSLRMFYCVPEIYSTWVIGYMLRKCLNQLHNTLLPTRIIPEKDSNQGTHD